MSQSKRAAAVLGIAVAIGAGLGAAITFATILAGLRVAPSVTDDLTSWTGSLGVASIAAIVGGIAGALTGAAAWSVAASLLLLVRARRQALPVQAVAVGIGGATGAVLVLSFLATRPGVTLEAGFLVVLAALAAALAVAALLVCERTTTRA